MHTRFGTFDVPPQRMDDLIALFRDRVVARFSQHQGFLGYQAYVDRSRGRLVGLSLWSTQEALEASAETARRARDEAAALGAVTVGEPQVLELAFDAHVGDAADRRG